MTLLLHTSSPTIRIGIADGDTMIARDEFPDDRQLAETLAERIRVFLQATRCQLHALRKIAVHSGPGGFTSLRIGVTTANALAYALGIPVVGITGDVKDLDDLLATSKIVEPAASGIAVPTYARPSDIGPMPYRG